MADAEETLEEFVAHAFHASFVNRTATGKLRVFADRVRFESEAGEVELPMEGLTISPGGHDGRQIFIGHPLHQDWTIYTSDTRILECEGLRACVSEQARRKVARPHMPIPLIVLGVFIVALIVLVFWAFSQRDRMVRGLAARVPASWEEQFGATLAQQIQTQHRVVEDAVFRAKLDPVVNRLVPAIEDAHLKFTFYIVQDTNINAFAIPGGHVFVHTGLINSADRPEEIAGVLAHEIAHVTQRHGFRQIIDSAGLYLIVQFFLGDASGLLAVLSDSSQFLLRQKFSRDFEREADDTGWQYLLEAKIDPRGMIDFFKKLKALEESGRAASLPGTLSLLSTHPATPERISRLEAKWNAQKSETKFTPIATSHEKAN